MTTKPVSHESKSVLKREAVQKGLPVPVSHDVEREKFEAYAERYRFLKPMYGMVNFDIYEAENEDDRQARIIFEKPKVLQKARTFSPATNESEK